MLENSIFFRSTVRVTEKEGIYYRTTTYRDWITDRRVFFIDNKKLVDDARSVTYTGSKLGVSLGYPISIIVELKVYSFVSESHCLFGEKQVPSPWCHGDEK